MQNTATMWPHKHARTLTITQTISVQGSSLHIPCFRNKYILSFYYERSELPIDGDGKKEYAKKVRKKSTQKKYAKKRAPSPSSLETLPASDSELRSRRSSGVRLTYTDPSGERQRAPSTSRWGSSCLHGSFRRASASSVHAAAVGSV